MTNIFKEYALLAMFCLSSILSGVLFIKNPDSILSALPLGVCLAISLLRTVILGISPGITIVFICFWGLIIDDISQVAWGRNYEAFTEVLGSTFYESFGITGIEFIIVALGMVACYKLITQQLPLEVMQVWPLLLVSSAFFLVSFYSMGVGLATGGDWQTHLIQRRFAHILPISSLIGLAYLDQRSLKFLYGFTVLAMVLKSMQAVFIYYSNYSMFSEAEYLVDHYFSIFCVFSLSIVVVWLIEKKDLPHWLKLVVLLSQVPVIWAFVLNDRRTAYVAMFLGLAVFLLSLPWNWFLRNRKALALVFLILSPLLLLGFMGPGSYGFFRETVLSVVTERGQEAPSYRDLENANLLFAVASQPLTGLGTGKEFLEVFPMPDISAVYDRYRMIPHNLMLASWAYGGPLTIAAMGLMFTYILAICTKLISFQRYFWGLPMLVFFTQYLAFTYADLAFQIPRNQLFAGLLLGAGYRCLRQS